MDEQGRDTQPADDATPDHTRWVRDILCAALGGNARVTRVEDQGHDGDYGSVFMTDLENGDHYEIRVERF